ncbi:hypothetical protein RRF68_09845 [Tenacibaculum sp. HL-MS23]|uniref:hypothetical protein n=1 Tax=Tenacibaculum sp. HL-MS23 TaxID=3077734 RepID=UPI0028FC1693|nr:hypothetical protein [Tenacibaculum sp. HL-MS23]WNW01295.1 hypothetical protein RRF68_09845 [Tenacibaculum sp. HL-MS23]
MKLTEQNIDNLYKFTRQHYVEHYDVQTELVDHLANDIEQIWDEKPTLSFEQARDISFKKFGIFGFMDVVEKKQRQLGKKYKTILWRYVKEWFQFPKIVVTTSVFAFYFCCLQFKAGLYLCITSVICLAIIDLYIVHKLQKEVKNRFAKNNKKWMLEDTLFNVASFGGVMVGSNIPHFINQAINDTPSSTAAFFIALFLTSAIIYSYVTLIVIPQKAEQLLEEHYPEYKIAR